MEPGPCRKSLGRWYYDAFHVRCIHFAYGGCEGNANRFMSQEECMSQCGYRNGPPDPKTLLPSYIKSPAPELQVTEQPVTKQLVIERPAVESEHDVRHTHIEGKKSLGRAILAFYL